MHYLIKKDGFSFGDIQEMPLFEFESHVDIMIRDLKAEAEAAQKAQNQTEIDKIQGGQ